MPTLSPAAPPADTPRRSPGARGGDVGRMAEIAAKVEAGQRLSFEEGVFLDEQAEQLAAVPAARP